MSIKSIKNINKRAISIETNSIDSSENLKKETSNYNLTQI